MANTSKQPKMSPLDSLIGDLLSYEAESESFVTDILFTGNQKAISSVPLRYRIIGLGFVKKLSLTEVNEKLVANGCEKLYGRSVYEASLMHAFNCGLSYEEWKSLFVECENLRKIISPDSNLRNSRISLNDIASYVRDNSDITGNTYRTQHLTQQVASSLSGLSPEKRALLDFMVKNIQLFSLSRECTRYYFCKYLMYFLETRRDNYLNAYRYSLSADAEPDLAHTRLANTFNLLSVFRASTKLTRKKYSPEDALKTISDSAVSLSEIYDEYQSFYFEYTTIDWLTVLLERYDDLHCLTKAQKNSLASSIRKVHPSVRSLSDDDVIAWKQDEIEKKEQDADKKYSSESKSQPYVSRTGESFLRKVIHGDIDLDRTTFLSFLLFFDKGSKIPPDHKINKVRLCEILANCGFPSLTDADPFDAFFIEYMNADDPMMFLIQEAEIMAMSEENFYLYKTYLSSKDNDKELSMVTTAS